MAESQNTAPQAPQGSGPLGQSGISPSGTVPQNDQSEFLGPHRAQNDSHGQVSRSSTEEVDRPEIPIEARVFCSRNGIEREIEETIDLARKHFALVGEPSFEVVDDPEHGESYVGLHIWARGVPEDVFRRRRVFSDAFRDSIGREKRRLINVIYHAV
jgi:hypothetical protein